MLSTKSDKELQRFITVVDGKYAIVQPEDETLVWILPFRWWHYKDLWALTRHFAFRYFRTTDKDWWRKVVPVDDKAWENSDDEEIPGQPETTPRPD